MIPSSLPGSHPHLWIDPREPHLSTGHVNDAQRLLNNRRRWQRLRGPGAQKFNIFNTFNIFDISHKEHGSGD